MSTERVAKECAWCTARARFRRYLSGERTRYELSCGNFNCVVNANRTGFSDPAALEPGDYVEPLQVTAESAQAMASAAQKATVPGVGPEAPTVVNDAGGKQSGTPYRMDLFPARAALAVAAVLKDGAEKYGENNWRKITIADNVNHALTHLMAHIAGDTQDDHLSHAACRILFALDLECAAGVK